MILHAKIHGWGKRVGGEKKCYIILIWFQNVVLSKTDFSLNERGAHFLLGLKFWVEASLHPGSGSLFEKGPENLFLGQTHHCTEIAIFWINQFQ